MLIILLGLFFRIFEKTPASLWTDEFATYWISSAPSLSECISRAAPTQGQSPFFYIIEWMVLKNAPHTENTLRLISLISSLISIGLVYFIAISMFKKPIPPSEEAEENEKPSSNHKITKSPNYKIIYIPAIFAALLFAVDTQQIYYAQEARPYALGIMFALFSQLFFMRLIKHRSVYNETLYIIFSALIVYTHYIIGTMLLVQNIWALFLICKPDKREQSDKRQTAITFINWVKIQIILIAVIFPLLFHLIPIMRQSSKWNWLRSGTFLDTAKILGTLFNPLIVIMFGIVFIVISLYKGDARNTAKFIKNRTFYFLFLWFLVPPLFAYFASKYLNTSILDARYMTLSLIPFYLFAAYCINALSNQQAKIFLMSFILFAYLGGVLSPAFKKEGRFTYHVPHDWRAAISHLNKHVRFGDVIILRSGYVKENWAPGTNNPIILDYVKAPLNSFYFAPVMQPVNHANQKKTLNIYNMTYTKEVDFYPYYDLIFDNCARRKRVWIMGVNPPNTNYLVSQLPEILRNSHGKYFEKDFSGVYLVMLKKIK